MSVGETQAEGGFEMAMEVEVGKGAGAVAVTTRWGTGHRLLGNWSYQAYHVQH